MGRESNEVEAHGVQANTNEAVEDDETRQKLASNTNEDALEDDEVEAHGIQVNTNEAVEDDETRQNLASNSNEDAVEDV